jgi:diguanylate cyclase (GGDEF)-like protein
MADIGQNREIDREVSEATTATILDNVAQVMTRLSVNALPRNFELFYESIYGHDASLAREIAALPEKPGQRRLDEIGLRHRLPAFCGPAQATMRREADDIINKLARELETSVTQKKVFGHALETIIHSIREDDRQGMNELLEELDYLAASAAALTRSETTIINTMDQGLAEIALARRAAEVAGAAALRDRLTHLPNAIAFSRRLQVLYSGEKAAAGTALVLADVRHFAAIREEFGAPASNHLLKRLGTVLRKAVKKTDFAARLDTDRFGFLFEKVTRDDARTICQRLQARIRENMVFASEPRGLGATVELDIGVAISDFATTEGELMAQAELALSVARNDPQATVISYAPELARDGGRSAA